ncbi:hypothetical protein [Acinetobacter proteolyticus]|uniref:Uncharacterized protein n=1 Tax=Acinetobacter proteolyticus TaxID=1776741 RepID=A0A2N0W9V2_9GAMM|nr:hypothetical protein [Acinetobacter proteolyticus]PKF31251.1 hypothetical protein CW311_19495 [Acinetobacter proteolyticus]
MTQDRENFVKEKLVEMLSDLFYIKEEVSGAWIINGSTLRLDLLLRPNEKAKQMGIDVEAIGIEIKDPQSKESVKKLLNCVMQAYTYSFCEFDGVRPAFILIYPDIEKFFDYDWRNKYKCASREEPTKREKNLLLRLMQRANVGELIVEQRDSKKYIFKFHGGPYFSSTKGRSKIKGIGLNRFIGSQKINYEK